MSRTSDRPRVVFDCNVLIQAISNGAGPAGQCLNLLQRNQIEVVVSRYVLKELRDVLHYPSVRGKLPQLDDQSIEAFIQRLAFRATLIRQVPHLFDYPRAKQDEAYLDLAAEANADYLVSRDNDLLSLMTDHSIIVKQFRQRLPRLSIVAPVGFLLAVNRP